MPVHPEFCLSKCNRRKKAVCIGINYVGQKNELRGCYNDARDMRDFLMRQYQFPPDQILLLTDADSKSPLPTRKEMFNAFMWLVKDAQKDDSLFFHYSGHGGQSRDASGREKDGQDEVIFPVDFDKAGDIIDDELYKSLVQSLPAGCRLTAIFDSCHSGTVLDLPYLHSAHGRLRSIEHISARAQKRGMAPSADVICFAACKDDETSADTFHDGVAVGAMSNCFIDALEGNPHQTYDELLMHLRHSLIPKYHQKAQISGTHPLVRLLCCTILDQTHQRCCNIGFGSPVHALILRDQVRLLGHICYALDLGYMLMILTY
ncbi:caspase domain-containing protein [Crepidotus variabilis]|uniref:Caspase domain-containing protein n=1 Tax=Crepidotus variabilis TaxID=179855 RepID=A0A9P6ELV5_9AGAR|nr:caspase domain-containing protein [Crepidotus variabilis]